MVRTFLLAAAALLLLGAKRPETVDYRLGFDEAGDAPAIATVEIRFRGDPDGETRLELPDQWASATAAWRYLYDLRISGAEVREDGPAARVLRHRPNARITVRYRVQTAYDQDPAGLDGNPYKGPLLRPTWSALIGKFAFAVPEGRDDQPATFRWSRLPKDWTAASDLEHGAMGRPMTVRDIAYSITLAGRDLSLLERAIPGGILRFATRSDSPYPVDAMADDVAAAVGAEREFWKDTEGPFFAAFIPLTPKPSGTSTGGTGFHDAFALYSTPGAEKILRRTLAHEHTHTWIPGRTGRQPSGPEQMATAWFSEGFTDFFTYRSLLRSGVATPEDTIGWMDETLKAYDANPLQAAPATRIVADYWTNPSAQRLPYQRGFLLALKWDEEIRRKTGGKADLDDVILRMRDHYVSFPPGQGPDVVTGLVSAAWVTAELDLRSDILRYAERGEVIELPEQLFDGCLDARVNVSPAFDSGFDHETSASSKVVQGVRRRGPAWNSGLRDGMRIEAMDLQAGDMTREIVLSVRPAGRGARPRTIRYWPYGDNDVEVREIALAFGLDREALAACGRKIAGL